MRTTLDLDDGVLAAARAIARDEGVSLGAAVSQLARRGLASAGPAAREAEGFPLFAAEPGAPPLTLELVNAHRDGD